MKLLCRVTLTLFLLTAWSWAQSPQHGINVQWTQGVCTGCTVLKNSVYSSPTATGTFTLLFTSTTPITSYLDPLTQSNQGTQNCYKVTAWTTIESAQSPSVCATFPTQAAAPTGPTATPQ